MARVINRATLELRSSVNTPEYSVVTWIINPNLSGLYNWGTGEYLVPKY